MIKRFLIAIFILASVTFAQAEQEGLFHAMGGLTGGCDSCLDNIPGSILADGNVAIAKDSNDLFYEYELDDDLSGTETTPAIINPDTNAGTKSWVLKKGPLEINNSTISEDGLGVDDLHSYAIPANVLGSTGCIEVFATGTVSGTDDTKTIILNFGSDTWTVITEAAGDENDWMVTARICNTATGAQRVFAYGVESDGTTKMDYDTATEDTTAAVTVKLTVSGAGNDTITNNMWKLILNP